MGRMSATTPTANALKDEQFTLDLGGAAEWCRTVEGGRERDGSERLEVVGGSSDKAKRHSRRPAVRERERGREGILDPIRSCSLVGEEEEEEEERRPGGRRWDAEGGGRGRGRARVGLGWRCFLYGGSVGGGGSGGGGSAWARAWAGAGAGAGSGPGPGPSFRCRRQWYGRSGQTLWLSCWLCCAMLCCAAPILITPSSPTPLLPIAQKLERRKRQAKEEM